MCFLKLHTNIHSNSIIANEPLICSVFSPSLEIFFFFPTVVVSAWCHLIVALFLISLMTIMLTFLHGLFGGLGIIFCKVQVQTLFLKVWVVFAFVLIFKKNYTSYFINTRGGHFTCLDLWTIDTSIWGGTPKFFIIYHH